MSLILNIETSSKNCSVCLSSKGKLIQSFDSEDDTFRHSELLTSCIQDILSENNIDVKDLSVISIGIGPGSFTGLRIGVAAAKGLCLGLNIPLLSINTLTILSQKMKVEKGTLIAPMIDARRMEVYTQLHNHNNKIIKSSWAEILNSESFHNFLSKYKIIAFGAGSEKCENIIKHKNFSVNKKMLFPSAKNMVKLSFSKWKKKQYEDIAYFEPYYLKDFYINKTN